MSAHEKAISYQSPIIPLGLAALILLNLTYLWPVTLNILHFLTGNERLESRVDITENNDFVFRQQLCPITNDRRTHVSVSQLARTMKTISNQKESGPKGYGGWLELFCAAQLYMSPALLLVGLFFTMASSGKKLSGTFFFVAVGSIAVVGFLMYAAIRLRGIHSGAVIVAKRALIAALAWANCSLVLPLVASTKISEASQSFQSIVFAFALIFFAIWFSYFNISKRVRATFPTHTTDEASTSVFEATKPQSCFTLKTLLSWLIVVSGFFSGITFFQFSGRMAAHYHQLIGPSRTLPLISTWVFSFHSVLLAIAIELPVLSALTCLNSSRMKPHYTVLIILLLLSVLLSLFAGLVLYVHFSVIAPLAL